MKKLMMISGMVGLLASMSIAGDSDKSDKKPVKNPCAGKTEKVMDKAKPNDSAKATDTTKAKEPEKVTTKLGVIYQDLVVGKGKECTIGTPVLCHYTLWLSDSSGTKGKRIQSSKDNNGRPYPCKLGTNLISGWSDGMVGMKEGGTRRLLIKPELGYGKAGIGPIPGNQWLVFEIDYVKHQ